MMTCSHCGASLVCRTCGNPVETPPPHVMELDELVSGALPPEGSPPSIEESEIFLVVARGHTVLYEQLKAVVGELGHVRVIEDRRRDRTLLPREGREGAPHLGP